MNSTQIFIALESAVSALLGAGAFLADMNVDLWTPMIQGGVGALLLGPIVYWFAMRFERIVERHTQAIERMTIANMVSALNTSNLNEALRALAEKQKADAEAALQK